MYMWPFAKKTSITLMSEALPRQEVLRRGRIAVLDDEVPEMLPDLSGHGLAVTHIISTEDAQFQSLADGYYDLLLLDYGGIGPRFGKDEGLDVLKYLKRVNPALRILAFTARTFDASKADFFRLCDGIVKKDAGIREMLEQIEANLSEVLTPAYQFAALERAIGLSNGNAGEIEKAMSKAIAGRGTRDSAIQTAKRFAKGGSEKVLEVLVAKAIELGITYISTNS
jgi:DNA-binding NarL/FixJ family response regulator